MISPPDCLRGNLLGGEGGVCAVLGEDGWVGGGEGEDEGFKGGDFGCLLLQCLCAVYEPVRNCTSLG